jgi:hypothetical protein
VPGPPPTRIAAILASGAPAALGALTDPAGPQPLLATVTRRALDKAPAHTRGSAPKPSPAGQGGGGPSQPPPAPPGSASAGGTSGAPGGVSTAQWCVVILVLLALTGRELRRFRFRLIDSTPSGFEPLLQRPG